MKTFQQKKELFNSINSKVKDSKMTVFTGYSEEGSKGLSVSDIQSLKKSLREIDGQYVVVKKTILEKVIKSMDSLDPKPEVSDLRGSLGLAFTSGDEAGTAKAIYNFSKSNPTLKLYGALYADKFINADQFIQLAKLPSREVMIGRFLGMLQYPISGFVNVLQGNIRKFVLTLKAIESNKS